MADLVELLHAIQGTAEAAEDAGLADRGVALREIEELATEALAALTASPAGDDPKAGLPKPIALVAASGWMPRVRALAWQPSGSKTWFAKTSVGSCEVAKFDPFDGDDGCPVRYRDFDDSLISQWFATVEEAKAAAQADYERRILAALDLPASGDGPKALDAEARAIAERDERDALAYAKRLAIGLQRQHYPEVVGFELLDNTLGVLTQIDNMTTGLVRSRDDGMAAARSSSTEAVEQEVEITDEMVTAFYEATEVTREGSILRIKDGLRAALAPSRPGRGVAS